MRPPFYGRIISCVFILVLSSASLSAQTENRLFLDAESSFAGNWQPKWNEDLRGMPVALNRDVLDQVRVQRIRQFTIETFEGQSYTVNVHRVMEHPAGGWSVTGRIGHSPLNSFTLSMSDDVVLSGIRIYSEHRFYQIRFDPSTGSHMLVETDPHQSDELSCGTHEIVMPDGAELYKPNILSDPQQAEGPALIDVMIVYTPAAEQWAEEQTGGIETVIMESMSQAQDAIDHSGLDVHFRLVHSGRVEYTENNDEEGSYRDLRRLTSSPEFQPWPDDAGYIDEIHEWRDEYGADLVAMFTVANDVGGLAWLLNSTHGLPHYGFSVTRIQQAAGLTHVHEMGHNFGNHHSRNQAAGAAGSEGGLYEYSTGWRWTGQDGKRYASVMTYEEGDVRVPHFSNPDIEHQGVPTGSYNGTFSPADNVRSMKSMKHTIANYRSARISISPPLVETFPVTMVGASYAQTGIRVVDNGGTAISDMGICWSRDPEPGISDHCFHAGVHDETFSYTMTGLVQGTEYHVRAFARNRDELAFGENRSFTTLELTSPAAETATKVSAVSFQANWQPSPNADEYLLELSTDAGFSALLPGYDPRPAGDLTSVSVTGLTPGSDYFYRIRSASGDNQSSPSNFIFVSTIDIDPEKSSMTASLERVLATGVQTSRIQIEVVNRIGEPVTGIPVKMIPDSENQNLSDPVTETDHEGFATFTITSETEKTVTYRAVAAGLEIGEPVTIEFLNAEGDLLLGNNFPNPFHGETVIPFSIPESGRARIVILNILGERVRVLVDQTFETGYYEVPFNAAGLAAGVYFYQLVTDEGVRADKMLLIR